jgi:hypothetical protein
MVPVRVADGEQALLVAVMVVAVTGAEAVAVITALR